MYLSLYKYVCTFSVQTENSMELELELNQKTGEWNTLQESGSELQPLNGPALTGLNNLGNSCNINCVMQVLFRMPDFVQHFVDGVADIFSNLPEDPVNDFNVQSAKVGVGLISGRYSFPRDDSRFQPGISLHMFRQLIGKGHPEFMTKRQQDAHEFYLHFLTLLEVIPHAIISNATVGICAPVFGLPNPSDCLKLVVEERIQCTESLNVKCVQRPEHYLPLPVPVAAATNATQVREYEARLVEAEASGQRL
ncbi:unnamed protein product [Pieris macdunnoughi]|uniref:ubiquitinyl hydrolase 1 n=1 Tax=Pieris macdunnoughi TaxID=345717 RepID=A0A821W565_9NEOP|nr:unnamed protein product [Pieris macdunnoughi]